MTAVYRGEGSKILVLLRASNKRLKQNTFINYDDCIVCSTAFTFTTYTMPNSSVFKLRLILYVITYE